jgi:hypothetical protein
VLEVSPLYVSLIFSQQEQISIEMMLKALKGRNIIAKGVALGPWNSKGELGCRV